MDDLGLFPLGVVLLPGERLPLHIFEERYRELIGECLDEEREFGLVLADEDGLRRIGTRAAVIEVLERFDDGRLNILVEGRERFRLLELTEGRSFQTGTVEPVSDEDESFPEAGVRAAVAALKEVAEVGGRAGEDLEPTSDRPSFELAARVELEPELKQRLLESRSEPQRLRMVASALRAAARDLRTRRKRAETASRNGRPG